MQEFLEDRSTNWRVYRRSDLAGYADLINLPTEVIEWALALDWIYEPKHKFKKSPKYRLRD